MLNADTSSTAAGAARAARSAGAAAHGAVPGEHATGAPATVTAVWHAGGATSLRSEPAAPQLAAAALSPGEPCLRI